MPSYREDGAADGCAQPASIATRERTVSAALRPVFAIGENAAALVRSSMALRSVRAGARRTGRWRRLRGMSGLLVKDVETIRVLRGRDQLAQIGAAVANAFVGQDGAGQ